jgi:protease-4
VQIKGEIADGKPANAVAINKALIRAFNDARARGVVLYVNSPGGSPVQSAIIHDRILALKAEHPDKPIVAVATDIVASGAYFVASAADRIYVNRSTITGSIGVMSAGFGFPDALQRLGIERRVFTAGEAKARLDPFMPLSDADTDKISRILGEIHEYFIESVTAARGDRLGPETAGLFEGDVWTGAEAIEFGLVDGLGDLTTVLQREFGVEHTRDYTVKPDVLDRLMRFAASTAIEEFLGYNSLSIR